MTGSLFINVSRKTLLVLAMVANLSACASSVAPVAQNRDSGLPGEFDAMGQGSDSASEVGSRGDTGMPDSASPAVDSGHSVADAAPTTCGIKFTIPVCDACVEFNCRASCAACTADQDCDTAASCAMNCGADEGCVSACLRNLSAATTSLFNDFMGSGGCIYDHCLRNAPADPAICEGWAGLAQEGDPCTSNSSCAVGPGCGADTCETDGYTTPVAGTIIGFCTEPCSSSFCCQNGTFCDQHGSTVDGATCTPDCATLGCTAFGPGWSCKMLENPGGGTNFGCAYN